MNLNRREHGQGIVRSLHDGNVSHIVGEVVRASKSHHDLIVEGVVSNKSEDSERVVEDSGDLNDSRDL
jgi:hypothetical protein